MSITIPTLPLACVELRRALVSIIVRFLTHVSCLFTIPKRLADAKIVVKFAQRSQSKFPSSSLLNSSRSFQSSAWLHLTIRRDLSPVIPRRCLFWQRWHITWDGAAAVSGRVGGWMGPRM